MKVWIDKKGGRHYHKENCPMVQDKRFPYEPVEKDIENYQDIIVGNKRYLACPGCFFKKRGRGERS